MPPDYNRKIPAHLSRHDFTHVGTALTEDGGMAVAGYIDNGQLAGKKITDDFGPTSGREQIRQLANVFCVPPEAKTDRVSFVEWINDRGRSLRFSAVISKRIELFDERRKRWVEVDSPPAEEARFRYLYSMQEIEAPRGETELHLDKSFWERRQEVAQT
jgi:hypothetical protein